MAHQAIKIRLYPNRQQQRSIRQNCGCCRFIYNHFLCQSIKDYELHEKPFNRYELQKELPDLKLKYPWLKDADSQSLQCSLLHLSQAYDGFFKGVSSFPKFKRKFVSRESFTIPQRMFLDPKDSNIKTS